LSIPTCGEERRVFQYYFIGSQRIATRWNTAWDQQVSAPDAGDSNRLPKKENLLESGHHQGQQALQVATVRNQGDGSQRGARLIPAALKPAAVLHGPMPIQTITATITPMAITGSSGSGGPERREFSVFYHRTTW